MDKPDRSLGPAPAPPPAPTTSAESEAIWCVVFDGRSVWAHYDTESEALEECERTNRSLATNPRPGRCTVVKYAPAPAPDRCREALRGW